MCWLVLHSHRRWRYHVRIAGYWRQDLVNHVRDFAHHHHSSRVVENFRLASHAPLEVDVKVVVSFLVALSGATQGETPATSLAAAGVGPPSLVVACNVIVQLDLVEEASAAHPALERLLVVGQMGPHHMVSQILFVLKVPPADFTDGRSHVGLPLMLEQCQVAKQPLATVFARQGSVHVPRMLGHRLLRVELLKALGALLQQVGL